MDTYIVIEKIFFKNKYFAKPKPLYANGNKIMHGDMILSLLSLFHTKILLKIIINKDDRYRIEIVNNDILISVSLQYLQHCISNYFIPDNTLIAILSQRLNYISKPKLVTPEVCIQINKYDIHPSIILPPMDHQEGNVYWMREIEDRYTMQLYNYASLGNYKEVLINDTIYYVDIYSDMLYSYESLKDCKGINIGYKIPGGILCDEVGLGKTLSFIALIMSDIKSKKKKLSIKKTGIKSEHDKIEHDKTEHDIKSTLIFCPKRLLIQWQSEIYKYISHTDKTITVYTIVNIKSIKAHTMKEMMEADIVLCSISMLNNPNYTKNGVKLSDIFWHRVILDESHEYLIKPYPCKDIKVLNTELFAIKSRYKWLCSGTPFAQGEPNACQSINYLADDNDLFDNILSCDYEMFILMHCRHNTKASISAKIPEPIHTIKRMLHSDYEKILYEDAGDNADALLKICSLTEIKGDNIDICIADKKQWYTNKIEDFITELSEMAITLQQLYQSKANFMGIKSAELTSIKSAIRYRKINNPIRTAKINETIEHYTKQISKLDILQTVSLYDSTCIITGEKINPTDLYICPLGKIYSKNGIKMLFQYKKYIKCPYTQVKLTANMFEDENFLIKRKWGAKIHQLGIDIKEILIDDNRIIIFSKYSETLNAIALYLSSIKIPYIIPHGTLQTIARDIHIFKTDKYIKILLLCIEKSSSGTNLIEASHIILFDIISTDKNLSKSIISQAIARSVRLGQNKNVNVLHYLIKDSIEETLHSGIF